MSVIAKQRPRAGRHTRAAALALALAIPGWAAPAAGETDYGALNAHVADDHVIPRYARLATSAVDLEEAVGRLCTAPAADTLTAAREAFHGTMDRWMAVEHVRVGPMEWKLRRQRLYFWPDFRGRGQRQLSKLLAAEDETRLASLAADSVAVQGLPALERVLFEAVPADFGGGGTPTYRCQLAQAIGRNVAGITRSVHEAWTAGEPAFRTVFVRPADVSTHYIEPRQTAEELFQGFYESLKAVEQVKLRKPLGEDAESARVKAFESWRSGRTERNLRLNVEAMHRLYADGFARLLGHQAEDRALDRRIEKTFTAVAEAIDGVEGDLARAAKDPEGHAEVALVARHVDVLSRLVGSGLAQAIGLSTGFNSLDGD